MAAATRDPAKAKGKREKVRHDKRGGYQKVHDGSNRPIRGLWKRNETFYARVAVADPVTGITEMRRVPLEGVQTVPQAIKKLHETRRDAVEGAISRTRVPTFSEYLTSYFSLTGGKALATIQKNKAILNRIAEDLGGVRLNRITPAMIRHQLGKREQAKMAGRTINLDLIALRSFFRQAITDGHIKSLPTVGIRSYKVDERMRRLISWSEVEAVCAAAKAVSRNGDQFADYIRLMGFAGCRRSETLKIKWVHVDFKGQYLLLPNEREKDVEPAPGLNADQWRKSQTKNRRWRVINFNSDLKKLLEDMWTRRAPDSSWLFPSPQRGERDVPAKTFTETLKLARTRAGNEEFNFHDLRHFFVSMCVMAGVDYMTIAKWVGHRDGGVLIGKVYGHLGDTHARDQATRVTLTPVSDPAQAGK